jgi:Histidine kinase-, DNA gyrase B-, and HSP90-like ATPase
VTIKQSDGPDGKAAVLVVRDEGLGIPQDDLPYVFDRVHRGANVVGRFAGTGIGLASAREPVELYGGRAPVLHRLECGSLPNLEMNKSHDARRLLLHHENVQMRKMADTRPSSRRFRPAVGWRAAMVEFQHQAKHWDTPEHGETGHLIAQALRAAVDIACTGGAEMRTPSGSSA